jgi:hypothetical protein
MEELCCLAPVAAIPLDLSEAGTRGAKDRPVPYLPLIT